MVKMTSLRKTTAEKRASEDSLGGSAGAVLANPHDEDGPVLHLGHHHLDHMKANTLRHGDRVTFHGEGTVEHSEESSGEGGMRRSARIRMTHGAMEHDMNPSLEKLGLRNEIETIHGKSEESREKRQEARNARVAKGGHKVPEKGSGG